MSLVRRPLVTIAMLTVLVFNALALPASARDPREAQLAQSTPAPLKIVTQSQAVRYVLGTSPQDADRTRQQLEDLRGSGFMRNGKSASTILRAYGPCELRPGTVYLRSSYARKAVGAKPKTFCTVRVSSIHHSTTLYWRWFLWWRGGTTTFSGGNFDERSFASKNVAIRCLGRRTTQWAGTTTGTITYRGRTYYARVYQEPRALPCGAA